MQIYYIVIVIIIVIISIIVVFNYNKQLTVSDNKRKLMDFINTKHHKITKYPGITLPDLVPLFNLEHYIVKKDHAIKETVADRDLYYYVPNFNWNIEFGWLLRSDINYYIPEGLIKIPKNTSYEWEPLNKNEAVYYTFF